MPPNLTDFFTNKSEKSGLGRFTQRPNYKSIFGLTFYLGSISIILGSYFPFPKLLGIFFPVTILFIYYWLIRYEKNAAKIEQAADSIYYLGFLYTLVALIVSLVVLSKNDYSLEGVGSRFGVALITTIIGLFLRVLLTNFRSSFEEKKTIAEDHLTNSIKEFSYQVQSHSTTLRTTTDLYKSSIERSINSMDKSIETLTSGFDSVSVKGVSQVNKTFTETNEKLSLAITNLFKKLELIKISEDILVSPIQEPIKKLAILLDEYKEGFSEVTQEQKKISNDNKLFTNNLKNLNESTKRLDDSIQKIITTFSSVKELDINTSSLNTSINNASATIEKLSSSLAQADIIQPNIEKFINSIIEINKETENLRKSINTHGEVISKIENISNSQLEMVKNHQTEIDKIMKEARLSLDLLNTGLTQSAQYITDELGRGTSGRGK